MIRTKICNGKTMYNLSDACKVFNVSNYECYDILGISMNNITEDMFVDESKYTSLLTTAPMVKEYIDNEKLKFTTKLRKDDSFVSASKYKQLQEEYDQTLQSRDILSMFMVLILVALFVVIVWYIWNKGTM